MINKNTTELLKTIGIGINSEEYEPAYKELCKRMGSAQNSERDTSLQRILKQSESTLEEMAKFLATVPLPDNLHSILHCAILRSRLTAYYAQRGEHEVAIECQHQNIEYIEDNMASVLNRLSPAELALYHYQTLTHLAALKGGLKAAHIDNLQEEKDITSSKRHSRWSQQLLTIQQLFSPPESEQNGIGGWETIPLKTIADYIWFTELQGLDTNGFDVHHIKHIAVAELLSQLGHPNPVSLRIATNRIESLKEWAMPTKQTELSQSLQQAFELPIMPRFNGRIKTSNDPAINLDVEGAQLQFISIPKGSFWMGSAKHPHTALDADVRDDERPRHRVHIETPLLFSTTPVTQAFWVAVMKNNPSKHLGDKHPVEMVSWDDAIQFCNALSVLEGLTPVYSTTDDKQTQSDWKANGYRLPTEAEWEYAAKAGTDQKYSGANRVDEVGWFYANSSGSSKPVGLKRSNAWGLHDMSGNVYEWCWDYFSSTTYQRDGDVNNPTGPVSGSKRVVRGGGWCNRAGLLRNNYRFYWSADSKKDYLGFRICRLQDTKD